jgi:molybdate transport system ATP-binding protein
MIELDLRIARGAASVHVELALAAHGVTAVIGRSGAGKSTLLLAVAGLLRPSSGRIVMAGRTLFDAARGIDTPPHQRGFGVVFQDGRLFPHLGVRANLMYGARLSREREGPAFDDVVQLLGIESLLSRRTHTLSGGERQRVAIGRALLCRPRALLMDEPLASLDPARRHELLGYLAGLPQRFGLPLIYVTHQVDEVLRLADQVVVMSDGRAVAAGPALAILSDLGLQPLVGRFEAGSVLAGRVAEQLPEWHLTRVDVAGQRITVPQLDAPLHASVRLRIRARDVALQRDVLASSASNQLGGTLMRLIERDGPYVAAELALSPDAEGATLWALVTRRSVHALGLAPGQRVVASFKAVAVEGRSVARFSPAPGADPAAA